MQFRDAARAAALAAIWFVSPISLAHAQGAQGNARAPMTASPPNGAEAKQPSQQPLASPPLPPPGTDADLPLAGEGLEAGDGSGNDLVRGDHEAPAAPAALDPQEGEDELTLDEWERDEWTATRPRVALFDVAGYYRVRGDLMRRLDFGNDAAWEQVVGQSLSRYPHPEGKSGGYSQLSMRLRIEPRLHVSDAVQIMSTLDLLDNVVFGSTPATVPTMGAASIERPVPHVLSSTQMPVRRGLNSFTDSIVIKRLWTRVGFLHDHLELKVGRMPDHWGLGFWLNSGDCLNCDLGTVADRISLSFRALGHVVTPHIDWISRGPLRRVFGDNDLAPISAAPWAGALAYGLRISKEEHPDDIRDALAHNRPVWEYGLLNAVRTQSRDLGIGAYQTGYNPLKPLAAAENGERRDAAIYLGDLFGKLYSGDIELGAEAAVIAGRFYDTVSTPNKAGDGEQRTAVLQLGLASEALWHLRKDRRGTRLSLKVGGASGDGHIGMGARDLFDTQRGEENGQFDHKLTAFQFSPDYHVDLLLFRRLLGTVTDAGYVRPEVAYRFDDKLSGRLALIYSQAMTGRSTPSSNLGGIAGRAPLGLEFDGELAYGLLSRDERGQLLASLAGGILLPLPGMRSKPADAGSMESGKFAWTVQARMYVTF